jgi:tetratricopeptide (TPR) repeat protein
MEEAIMAEKSANGHPDGGLLDRFMRDDVGAPDRRRVVRHLLTGCPSCVAVTRRIWEIAGRASPANPSETALSTPADRPASYDEAIAHALAAGRRWEEELAAERRAAPGLFAKLLATPAARRLSQVRRSERCRSVGLLDLLLERCRDERRPPSERPLPGGPESTRRIEIAELTVAVAERLDPAVHGPSVARDLLGRAWVESGQVRLFAGDLPGAERAIRSATPLFAFADTEPRERLELLRLEAAVAAEAGRAEEADRLLDRAAATARAAREPHLLGSVLVERGTLQATTGRYGTAIDLLGEAVELLDEAADPVLLASALHRRAALLLEVERAAEARGAALRLAPLYERLGNRPGLLRLRWLVGKIDEDEVALLETREGLLAEGLGLAAAQVSLDLAVVYAKKGLAAETRRLAGEIFPIFRNRDLRREAMAALLVFRRAVETGSASLEFLVEVARYLLGSRRALWRGI